MVAKGFDWGYTAQAGRQVEKIIRGKIVGGSSAVNAQIYLWGLPYDFENWGKAGNDQWAWESVAPYFRKVETDLDFEAGHGKQGPIQIRRYAKDEWLPTQRAFYEACIDHGFADCPDLNEPYATGVGPYPMNNPGGIRLSAAIGYLNPVRDRANLQILSETETTRVLFDGPRATGIEVLQGSTTGTIEAKEVVVSAGAIGSPLLLQRSGIGNPDHLSRLGIRPSHDLRGVGENLRDHPAVPVYWSAQQTGPGDIHWHQVGLRYTAADSPDHDDMIVYVAHVRDEPKLLMRPTVNLARSAGRLSITSSDPSAQPAIDYRMFSDPFDLKRMREAVRLCGELAKHDAFGPHLSGLTAPTTPILESDRDLDDWILDNATTGHHVCGTCRMGPECDALSVVDETGNVHGLDHLRIVDASIMPDCVRANIHATVLMMAEKLADQHA